MRDLTGVSDRVSSSILTDGNPDLEPEISYTGEVGWRYHHKRDLIGLTAF